MGRGCGVTGGRDMQLRFRWLVEDVDRYGNIRIYVRVPDRRKVRIRAPFGSAEFLAAYTAAVNDHVSAPLQAREAKPGSFGWSCLQYYASATFKLLDPATQTWRRRALDAVAEKHAHKPVALMQARHVRDLRNELKDKPGAANQRLKALKALFAWACEDEPEFAPITRPSASRRSSMRRLVIIRGPTTRSNNTETATRSAAKRASRSICCSIPADAARMPFASGRSMFAMVGSASRRPRTSTETRSRSISRLIRTCLPPSRRHRRNT